VFRYLIFISLLFFGCTPIEAEEEIDYWNKANENWEVALAFENLVFDTEIVDTFTLDEELYFVEKQGYIWKEDGELVFDLRNKIEEPEYHHENGLQSVEVTEDAKGFFLSYTEVGGSVTVSYFDFWDVESEEYILRVERDGDVHAGGGLILDNDILFASFGDGYFCTLGLEDCTWAQDNSNYRGTVSRIDLVSGSVDILGYGFRHPWRFEKIGKKLVVFDTGQTSWEEINIIDLDEELGNYGWPYYEGNEFSAEFTGVEGFLGFEPELQNYTPPNYFYPIYDKGNCAIIGGPYKEGIGEKDGSIYFGDFCSGRIWKYNLESIPELILENKLSYLTHLFFIEDSLFVSASIGNGRYGIYEVVRD